MGDVPERFERDYGCTEAEWLRWLPEATQGHPLAVQPGHAQVQLGAGTLDIAWQALPPRRIALVTLPRLGVRFAYQGVPTAARQAFQRVFDLSTQRGGG
jgi:hypothetical protein